MSARPIQALVARSEARVQRLGALLAVALILDACAVNNPASRTDQVSTSVSTARMLAAIHEAGADDHSVLQIHPLGRSGVDALAARARTAMRAGDYAHAGSLLDQALVLDPKAPDLLQDRAEVALASGNWPSAARLARKSVQYGPRFGALCARGWQTLAELAQARGESRQYAADVQRVAGCRRPDPLGE